MVKSIFGFGVCLLMGVVAMCQSVEASVYVPARNLHGEWFSVGDATSGTASVKTTVRTGSRTQCGAAKGEAEYHRDRCNFLLFTFGVSGPSTDPKFETPAGITALAGFAAINASLSSDYDAVVAAMAAANLHQQDAEGYYSTGNSKKTAADALKTSDQARADDYDAACFDYDVANDFFNIAKGEFDQVVEDAEALYAALDILWYLMDAWTE